MEAHRKSGRRRDNPCAGGLRKRGPNARRLSRNHEDLIGPRIFCFAAGRVAAYVDVSPFRIEGTKDVSGLARHRFSRWKHGFGGRGSERSWRKAPHDRLRTEGDLSEATARASAPTSRA